MKALEILERTKELIAKKSHWTQGIGARNKDGIPVNADDPNAVCWCMLGALANVRDRWQVDIDEYDKAEDAIRDELSCSIWQFNDSEETTHKDVLSVLDKAIERVKYENA